jgi:hypothetical protein
MDIVTEDIQREGGAVLGHGYLLARILNTRRSIVLR